MEYNNKITNLGLLSSTNRVEAPFVRVKIGNYSFGVFEGNTVAINENGYVSKSTSRYPNYVQHLNVKKIDGTVNQYKLQLSYPITENDDPNYFEKVFSSVSKTREIEFSYGDSMVPEYSYKEEKGIITKITTSFDIKSSVINYTIDAVSVSSLTLSGAYNFPSVYAKPSDVILRLVQSNEYHLTDIFVGMQDISLVKTSGMIAGDDVAVKIPTMTNISILDYISKLVSYMSSPGGGVYTLTTYEDTTGTYGGAYFKVQKLQSSSSSLNQLCTYAIDIGYPTANIVTSFSIKNDDNWSIYYDYNEMLGNSEYLKRIDSNGNIEYVYSPQLGKTSFTLKQSELNWWRKVTQYPMSASITLKGLLKPAILMQYVKLNVWFWGKKHISSGYYIIKSQVDDIGLNGFTTTLELVRVGEDDDLTGVVGS